MPSSTVPPLPTQAPAGTAKTLTLSSAAPATVAFPALLTKLRVVWPVARATNVSECGIHPIVAALAFVCPAGL